MADRPQPPSVALLVEDDRDLSDLEVALIEETDLRPIVTASAEEALSYLEQNGAEVALLWPTFAFLARTAFNWLRR